MRVVFMGTPDFAVPCLEALHQGGYDITGVFAQPAKPVGRKMVLTQPEVAQYALDHGLKLYQPEKMKDGTAYEMIKECDPELIVAVAYGKILPKEILDYPRYGCINIHGSLLPKYRGAGPIQWSVIDGEAETGVTSMYMEEGLDTGDMLVKRTTPIGENETAGELFDRLKVLGAQVLLETLTQLENGTLTREKQKEEESSYAPMLNKEMACIDFTKSAKQIHNLVRGLNPWPVAYTMLEGKKLKVYATTLGRETSGAPAGTVLGTVKGKGLEVACGQGTLYIKELQAEGKKRMAAEDFLRGKPIAPGTQLGEKE